MRFGKKLYQHAIPQWKYCYINYTALKLYVSVIKYIVEQIEQIQKNDCFIRDKTKNYLTNDQFEVNNKNQKIIQQLQQKLHDFNKLFFIAYFSSMRLVELFYQMKLLEMQQKFIKCQIINEIIQDDKKIPIFLSLVEYIYIETIFIMEMKKDNQEGSRKILKKHKKYSNNIVDTPIKNNQKFFRFQNMLKSLINEIQNFYVSLYPKNVSKKCRLYLRETASRHQTDNSDSFFFGLWVGISSSIFIVLIAIIIINNLQIQSDANFARDFPCWRGIAILIFYIWILAFNIYMFEIYRITHRLIFKFQDHHYSTSTDIFKVAATFTSFFLILYLFYLLSITNIINFGSFKPQYFALICWSTLILYLIFPFPIFNVEGRWYAIKLMGRSLAAPCFGVTFPVIWMTDQLVSLATPLQDFAYTICYYTQIDFSSNNDYNPCKQNSRVEIVLVVGVIAYSYRIMQCIRQGYDKGIYFFQPQFFNTLKYASSFITLLLSFIYKVGNNNILYAWLLFACISTIYSYIWDIKIDWALLQPNQYNYLLRKYITFQPKYQYYAVMVSNFLMRLVWILTLSPSITQIYGNKNVVSLATGMIEIFRRGIWNLLRVQRQHIANCGNFKALPETQSIQRKLIKQSQKQISTKQQKLSQITQGQKVKNQFLIQIKMQIQIKQKMQRAYCSKIIENQMTNIDMIVSRIKKN